MRERERRLEEKMKRETEKVILKEREIEGEMKIRIGENMRERGMNERMRKERQDRERERKSREKYRDWRRKENKEGEEKMKER